MSYNKKACEKYYANESTISKQTNTLIKEKKLIEKISKYATVVSLGSGNCKTEIDLINSISKYTPEIIAIDSSEYMLMTAKNIAYINQLKIQTLRGDFTSGDFLKNLKIILSHYQKPIVYIMLGGTFGNIEPSIIINTISHIMNIGDLFIFDINVIHDSQSQNTFIKYMENLAHKDQDFFLDIYKGSHSTKDEQKNKSIVNVDIIKSNLFINAEYYIAKNEKKINIFNIYAYKPAQLKKFFEKNKLKITNTIDIKQVAESAQAYLSQKIFGVEVNEEKI